MNPLPHRRDWLKASLLTALPTRSRAEEKDAPRTTPFRFCLNTATIRGQNLPIDQVVDLAAQAGYDGIEPWIDELDRFRQSGGDLKVLGRKIRDLGLSVESAIGFASWLVDDETARRKGLSEARRAMEMVKEIGGGRIAAPPAGATQATDLPISRIAERYRALLDLGAEVGVVPQLEVWGFSRVVGRLSDAVAIAIEADHPQACLLADVYHLYKGGSGFQGLRLLGPHSMHVFHINDYPAQPPRTEITDAHRVYPGDGIAPLANMLRILSAIGFRGALSLELFHRDYWKQDPRQVARTGLDKMKAVVQTALKM